MTTTITALDDDCVFVLFGATGDLAKRKLVPALYHLYLTGHLPKRFQLVGTGRTELSDGAFRERMAKALADFADADPAGADVAAFLERLFYASQRDGADNLRQTIERRAGNGPILYYLALGPDVAEKTLTLFNDGGLPSRNARIMLEKPFGLDLEAARRLNGLLDKSFPEEATYRIDHYFAKDTVRNLLIFRFANAIFEPLWNRHYVDHIQVSATETIGVEDRGAFYDSVGVVRDMLQNHVLMLLSLATMEPPLAGDSESIRDRMNDLLRSIAPPEPNDFIFGQYEGYRQADKVAPDSTTPTFAAVRLGIGNWRWHGVPVYLLSGKCLKSRVSEVSLVFKHIPLCLLESGSCNPTPPNMLTLRIHPDEGIRMSLGVKAPGYRDLVVPSSLDFRYSDLDYEVPIAESESFNEAGHHLFTGYERVLLEALAGRSNLFWRADAIESAWKIVDPLLRPENRPGMDKFVFYKPGTWGVEIAKDLFSQDHKQWLSSRISKPSR